MLQDIATIETKYKLFVERVAASKQVWGLKSKAGWANSESNEDEAVTVIPFWSDRALAKACARDDWKNFTPTEISVADFLENWCIGMAEDETLAGLNWDANMFGKETDALSVAVDVLNRLNEINSAISFTNYSSITEFITDISEEQ